MTREAVLSSLLDRESYLPGLWDLHLDEKAKAYWIDTLSHNLLHMVDAYTQKARPEDAERCRCAQAEYLSYLSEFESSSDPKRPKTVNALVEIRQVIFEKFGIPDPYKTLKETENAAALAILPQVSSPVPDEAPLLNRLRWAFSLVMAGNFFDMGSAAARDYHTGVSAALLERAVQLMSDDWFKDDTDALSAYLDKRSESQRRAVVCIDNAGAEVVLGVPALFKTLAPAGFSVTIVANESPALNDMTASETRDLLKKLGHIDPEVRSLLKSESLAVISSGSKTSGLDLRSVSTEFDEAASRAEILIIIGQGRAVETNWHTKLAQPWARVAVVKDTLVARAVGCEVFDPLITFDAPG